VSQVISEAIDELKMDDYDRKKFWNSVMDSLAEWLEDSEAPEKR